MAACLWACRRQGGRAATGCTVRVAVCVGRCVGVWKFSDAYSGWAGMEVCLSYVSLKLVPGRKNCWQIQ